MGELGTRLAVKGPSSAGEGQVFRGAKYFSPINVQ